MTVLNRLLYGIHGSSLDELRDRLIATVDVTSVCVADQDQGGSIIWTGLDNEEAIVDAVLAEIQRTHLIVSRDDPS